MVCQLQGLKAGLAAVPWRATVPAAPDANADMEEMIRRYHSNAVAESEAAENAKCSCSAVVVQEIQAPLAVVWSLVRRFESPQSYKRFIRSCEILGSDHVQGAVKVGSLRKIRVVSGLPAATSTERLEILDDDRHVFSFSMIGGDHRLSNYRSVTSLHSVKKLDCNNNNNNNTTLVVESYVVDVPPGNSREDTKVFVDTIVRCNLQSLDLVSRRLYQQQQEQQNSDS